MEAAAQLEQKKGIERMDSIRYTDYLALTNNAFNRLLAYYGDIEREAQTNEAESMALYVHKIIVTIESLRLKYACSPSYLVRPAVDLADSGFPHFHDITMLDSDLASRDERLPKFASEAELRSMLLETLMQPGVHTPVRDNEIVQKQQWQIAERAYLENLDLRTHFFRFTPGKLFAVPNATFREEGRRTYSFSWGCYDSARNRPCVYFLLFTQDESETPLDQENNPEYIRFLRMIDSVASRAPDRLDVIATRLDETFGALYPKALKRIILGPLVSPLLYSAAQAPRSKFAQALMPMFESAQAAENDFVMCFTTEMVISEREQMPAMMKSVLGLGKARQIFRVPKADRELLARGSNAYHNYCILPHRVRQELSDELIAGIPELAGADLLAYQRTEKGVTNVG
jgi:hypothetical protein